MRIIVEAENQSGKIKYLDINYMVVNGYTTTANVFYEIAPFSKAIKKLCLDRKTSFGASEVYEIRGELYTEKRRGQNPGFVLKLVDGKIVP